MIAIAPKTRTLSPALPTVELKNLRLHAITEQQCVEHILAQLDSSSGGWVVTPNLDILRRCVKDSEFDSLVRRADLLVADGMPLVWASKLQHTPLPERVAGSTLIWSLSKAAGQNGRSIYLLGGSPGSAEGSARVLKKHCPGLKVAGTSCPPPGFESDEHALQDLLDNLVYARPDIIYVALGSPKQERLIAQIREHLPESWWLGIGISFSFVTGEVKRAPQWMQQTGMEWLHRLTQQPGRLARRYLVHGVPFAADLLTSSAARGFTRRV